MKSIILSLCALLWCATCLKAQDKWDLRKCVDYALANNISIRQADVQVKLAQLAYQQSRGSQLPTLNLNINSGYNFGLSENPTTGTLENLKSFSTTAGMQSSILLFNFFSVRNLIAADKLSIEAESAQTSKIKDDIALNVALAYLQILLSGEQVNISRVVVEQDRSQLDLTQKKVNAGVLPELNAAELEAQLAADSSLLITAQSTYQQYLLQMKALLNLDAATPFEITTPPVEAIPVESLADLQPEAVYELAVKNLPQQKVDQLRIQAAQKRVQSARGEMYPSVSAFGSLNSRFLVYRTPTYSSVITGYQPTQLRVDAGGGNFYNVESPIITQGARSGYITSDPLGSQLVNNFGQGLGIGIQVPILNGLRAKINYNRSKLNVRTLELQYDLDKLTLKQDIYTAYNDATTAIQKYNASKMAVAAAEKAYDFAQKRYNVNLLSTYDLINSSNRLTRARIDLVSARFEYVFRLKLLEFYKGQGLKL